MNKKVSIIVPIYNSENYLKQCLESLVRQTYKNTEIILINDGSTDNSKTICEEFASKDNRIKIFNTENKGVSAARNLGIENAKGEYLLFIDSDDYIEIYTIEEILKQCKNYALLAFSYYELYNNKLVCNSNTEELQIFKKEEALEKILSLKYINGFACNKLFKREIVNKYKIRFNTNIKVCEDLLFCCQYIDKIDSMICIGKPYYYYRQHINSVMYQKLDAKYLTVWDVYKIIEKIYSKNNINKEFMQEWYVKVNLMIKEKAFMIKDKTNMKKSNKIIKKNLKYVILSKNINFKEKTKIIIKFLFIRVYCWLKIKKYKKLI